jgi:hypothetical protein
MTVGMMTIYCQFNCFSILVLFCCQNLRLSFFHFWPEIILFLSDASENVFLIICDWFVFCDFEVQMFTVAKPFDIALCAS